jgi:hypothetical protein
MTEIKTWVCDQPSSCPTHREKVSDSIQHGRHDNEARVLHSSQWVTRLHSVLPETQTLNIQKGRTGGRGRPTDGRVPLRKTHKRHAITRFPQSAFSLPVRFFSVCTQTTFPSKFSPTFSLWPVSNRERTTEGTCRWLENSSLIRLNSSREKRLKCRRFPTKNKK